MHFHKIHRKRYGTGIGFKTHRDQIKEYYGGFWNPLLYEKFDCLVCGVACKRHQQTRLKKRKNMNICDFLQEHTKFYERRTRDKYNPPFGDKESFSCDSMDIDTISDHSMDMTQCQTLMCVLLIVARDKNIN